ncbi:GAF domain-containing protein [Anabaena cylindrica FACHB-243]|uniref:Adenylate/guanylate cyclase with GAF and PAS/PAC sensors n=1 Tax=Anabaena cylindrica (strain ATCC 27899 / PCC 7122) TaxID=272123 RepID=K9ZJD9_ANACC|nr:MULTISPECIES: adenylate/guanylate cyclase domain-containing protein [Anabaena]AFZ59343.1 adenylate/guanylate cyclase with GAF and PAS/PAC sensors [Anabaena cylindrica PCC 7122]MBD2416796.1 GAF domain-containing protein [Anabaena cylindrica FACHB-243]MBY5280272.1 GAF domain-containing protein [Anabaena sp. CCAP 1446/1C]MBY5310240.1 GAF domain-containing protein [Anabaena sp. CCAP 1446/1C]MCM2405262.1 GAF domain-containing protein [Anabaena sp. CCAP 1446/1C]
MTLPNAGSVLATLTELTQVNRTQALLSRVKDLSVNEFVCLLDFITAEFQQFLRAIDLINNEALESMLEKVLEAITLKIGQILQAEHTAIFLVDYDKAQLWSKVPQDNSQKFLEIRTPLNVGIPGYVASTGKYLNIAETITHPLFSPELEKQMGYKIRNLLCMPVISSKKQTVAVVQLANKAGDVPFNQDDEESFRDFAASIGIILESCQSFYVAARNQRGATALLRATQTLGQSLDLEATLQIVMEQARILMQADRSTLFLYRKEMGELWTKVATVNDKNLIEVRIPSNRGIAGYVASTGQALNIPDAYQDPRFDPTTDHKTGYVTRNILCLPVFNSANELIGVTQLINKQQGSFSTSDEEFMRAFNIQAGIALENARLFESVLLERQYQKDILQSLSDAVISTDMQGQIVTINDAALELLGCPLKSGNGRSNKLLWKQNLLGRQVWEVVPIENLQGRLEDSLKYGARHYVPEQILLVGLYQRESGETQKLILAVRDRTNPNIFVPWNQLLTPQSELLSADVVKILERSINLTVNPLTNPEGGVRGGLVVLEDISREKRLKSTMYRYLTPHVAEQVMALGDDSLMVGERKEVTVLFSDIRGYTTLTENLGAAEVVSLLNQYFETMVESVFQYEGTLDKFIGDALMAVFGAPLPLTENHAWRAIQSALDMRYRLKEFNLRRIVQSQPQIRIGIGLSSGEVVSGNIGSHKRMDYTVIGDGVNLSSRLESVTKEYGCDIILSEFTYNLCSDRIWVRQLDRIRVKGKHQAVDIYELISDRSTPLDANTEEFLHHYNAGRVAYVSREFSQAITCFEIAQRLRPTDQAVDIHLERAYNYQKTPPPKSWDGVWTMMTK